MEGVIPEVSAGYALDEDRKDERAAGVGTKQDGGDAGTVRQRTTMALAFVDTETFFSLFGRTFWLPLMQ